MVTPAAAALPLFALITCAGAGGAGGLGAGLPGSERQSREQHHQCTRRPLSGSSRNQHPVLYPSVCHLQGASDPILLCVQTMLRHSQPPHMLQRSDPCEQSSCPSWVGSLCKWESCCSLLSGVQNYVFALRACLKEMEVDGPDEYTLLERLAYLTRDLVSHAIGSNL